MPTWPEEVSAALQHHDVVAITSGLTDLREAEALLDERLPGRWARIEWGMGSAANRARFHDVQAASGFQMLPMFIGHAGLIGGVPELRRYLAAGLDLASVPASGSAQPDRLLHWLGYSGLIPFVFFGAGVWFGPALWQSFSLHALTAYGAVILSFLGAVHWGLYLADPAHRVPGFAAPAWAVIPSVAGWGALLLPTTLSLLVLLMLFPLVLWVDRASLHTVRLPYRYLVLRGYLTLGAILSLLSGTLASLTHP